MKHGTSVKIVYQEFHSDENEDGPICYYARAFVIVGTLLPETQALDTYTEKTQSLGWTPEGRQYEISRILIRGVNDRIVIGSGEPGVDIKDALDYDKLRETYRSIIFVRLDYMLPSRDEC